MTRGFVFSFKKTLTGGGRLNDVNRHMILEKQTEVVYSSA